MTADIAGKNHSDDASTAASEEVLRLRASLEAAETLRLAAEEKAARLASERDSALQQVDFALTVTMELKRVLASFTSLSSSATTGLGVVQASADTQAAHQEIAELRESIETLRREQEAEICAAVAIAQAIERSNAAKARQDAVAAEPPTATGSAGPSAVAGKTAAPGSAVQGAVLLSDDAPHLDVSYPSHVLSFLWLGSPLVFALVGGLMSAVAFGSMK